jgi:hypothetical protein
MMVRSANPAKDMMSICRHIFHALTALSLLMCGESSIGGPTYRPRS